jgi:hypothetical protein
MYNPTQADQQRQRSMMEMRKGQPLSTNKKPMAGMAAGGALNYVPEGSKGKGLSKLPTGVRNKMGFKNRGGMINKGNKDYRKSGMFYGKGDK